MGDVAVIHKEDDECLEGTLREKLEGIFRGHDMIAVKLHMGEAGNRHFVRPETVSRVIRVLRDLDTRPFLFDSPVMYPGSRDTVSKYLETARRHGFFDVGCEVVVSNASRKVNGFDVCTALSEADGLFAVSHGKGHMCTGFAAAIKNLGMGGVSLESKRRIHIEAQPVCSGECSLCGICVDVCAVSAPRIQDEKVVFNYDFGCWGCGVCIEHCPEKALEPRRASFDRLIAESAMAVLSTVRKAFYMNVILDVTTLCDCCSDPGEVLAEDIGFVLGDDIVSVDRTSLHLIHEKSGRGVFEEVHRKSPSVHIAEVERIRSGDTLKKRDI